MASEQVSSHSLLEIIHGCVDVPAKIESTIRYLGIEVDDALELAEQTEV
jgi:hypothetical protein